MQRESEREREKKVIAESEAELLSKANQSHKVERAKNSSERKSQKAGGGVSATLKLRDTEVRRKYKNISVVLSA